MTPTTKTNMSLFDRVLPCSFALLVAFGLVSASVIDQKQADALKPDFSPEHLAAEKAFAATSPGSTEHAAGMADQKVADLIAKKENIVNIDLGLAAVAATVAVVGFKRGFKF